MAGAKAAAGWAMLVVYPVNGRQYNVVSDEHAQGPLWLSVPLVVIDTYEHAFQVGYQNKKAEYVEKFLTFVDRAEADRRYRAAVKGGPATRSPERARRPRKMNVPVTGVRNVHGLDPLRSWLKISDSRPAANWAAAGSSRRFWASATWPIVRCRSRRVAPSHAGRSTPG